MKLTTLFERLYVSYFIAIVQRGEGYEVALESRSSGESERDTITFDTFSAMSDFITEHADASPYCYIATLSSAQDQGAIPTCDKIEMREFADTSLALTLCFDERWSVYCAKSELGEIERLHAAYGLDCIFSPFTILQRFFADKIEEVVGLYVLVQHDAMTIAVYSKRGLEFGEHLHIDADEMMLDEQSHDMFESEEQEDHEIDDFDELDVLDDIESLDDLESLDDIDDVESFEDFNEDEASDMDHDNVSPKEGIDGYNLDFHRFTMIQHALQRFYSGDHYDNAFVEAVFIADAVGVGADFKNYLEEELFVIPILRKIELANAVLELCKEEVGSAS